MLEAGCGRKQLVAGASAMLAERLGRSVLNRRELTEFISVVVFLRQKLLGNLFGQCFLVAHGGNSMLCESKSWCDASNFSHAATRADVQNVQANKMDSYDCLNGEDCLFEESERERYIENMYKSVRSIRHNTDLSGPAIDSEVESIGEVPVDGSDPGGCFQANFEETMERQRRAMREPIR